MEVLAALLSAGFVTAKDVVSKRLSKALSATLSTFFSFLFAIPYHAVLLLALYAAGIEGFSVEAGFYKYIVLRALTDTAAEWFKMRSFASATLSTVSSVLSLSPALLLIVSPLLTGDLPTPRGVIGTLAIVTGSIVIVYDPRARSSQPIGILCALAAAVCFAINSSLDRLAVQTASPALSAFAMAVLSALFMVPRLTLTREPVLLHGKGRALWLRGLFEVLFMISKLTALQRLQAPYVIALQRFSLLFAVLSGRYIFEEENFWRKMAGALLVVAGGVGVAFA